MKIDDGWIVGGTFGALALVVWGLIVAEIISVSSAPISASIGIEKPYTR